MSILSTTRIRELVRLLVRSGVLLPYKDLSHNSRHPRVIGIDV